MIEIYNNDCLDFIGSQNYLELTNGRKVVLVTDPPFNIGYHYNTYKDNLTESEYLEFLEAVFTNIELAGLVVIHYPEMLYKIAFQIGYFPTKVVSWVYNSNTAKQHRDIAFFKVEPNFNQVRQPYKNPNDKRIKERIKNGAGGGRLYDWWNINQVKNVSKDKTSHPCQMPLQVMERIIGILPKDIIVFDPFTGSGTTGVACKKLGYDFIGCEIDEDYFNIAQKRISADIYEQIEIKL